MYRIVKDTYKDGSVKYRVQTDRFFFGWFRSKTWRDCEIYKDISDYMSVLRFPAVFNTIEEAERFCGMKSNPIVNTETVEWIIKKEIHK